MRDLTVKIIKWTKDNELEVEALEDFFTVSKGDVFLLDPFVNGEDIIASDINVYELYDTHYIGSVMLCQKIEPLF